MPVKGKALNLGSHLSNVYTEGRVREYGEFSVRLSLILEAFSPFIKHLASAFCVVSTLLDAKGQTGIRYMGFDEYHYGRAKGRVCFNHW